MASASGLASLLKQTHIVDDEEILKAAETAAKQSKGDLEAQHVRVVALLRLDRYEEALKVLEAGGQKLKDKAALETAYALYKSGDSATAARVAQNGSQRAYKHLEAQARYRAEEFSQAATIYKQLASNLESDAEIDLKINSGAVDAQLEWSGQGTLVDKKKPSREDMEVFETAFNAACGSIARGELGQAEVLLKRAKNLGSALEDLNEQERQAEMLPVTVQQVYVLARLGRQKEAEELAQSLDVQAISDASTKLIAQINQLAASPIPNNSFLAQRLVNTDLKSLRPNQPFEFQSRVLERSRLASDLLSLKYTGTASSTAKKLSDVQGPNIDAVTNSLSVFNAAAHARNQTGKEALKQILPILEQRPKDVGLILTITQLYVLTGNSAAAVNLLHTFLARLEQSGSTAEADVRFSPGLVGAVVSLYHSQGRKVQARAELLKAASHWRRKTKDRPVGVEHLMKHAGSALLDSQEESDMRVAREIFTELHDRVRDDRYATAGLLAVSPEAITKEELDSLTPIDRLIAGIDADALENAGIAQLPSSASASTNTRKRPADAGKPKKAKKIKKSRVPKEYDPNKTPDPERWRPLRDRSTYRPKGKKGKARQALLSQGAVASETDGSRPGTPGGEIVKQKQGGGGAANKKKKGKGTKW